MDSSVAHTASVAFTEDLRGSCNALLQADLAARADDDSFCDVIFKVRNAAGVSGLPTYTEIKGSRGNVHCQERAFCNNACRAFC